MLRYFLAVLASCPLVETPCPYKVNPFDNHQLFSDCFYEYRYQVHSVFTQLHINIALITKSPRAMALPFTSMDLAE